ncbi:MAG: iron-sulfur cluster repair di-iron protein [Planctomycetota bacterium]|nr:iron-sulfur cluster repair di-iron protein [Planctomycetota bacterium]
MQTPTITRSTPVGHVATAAPLATRVFARHGIDYCCGGGIALEVACARQGIEVDAVLAEIEAELESTNDDVAGWGDAPLDALIEHILRVYHRPLDEELPRLEAMAQKVHRVHGEKDPERLGGLSAAVSALKAELEPHMMKEEQILFPMILAGQGAMAGGPVHVMEIEHEEAGALLRTIRELTNDFEVPAAACNTWRALWHGLADLERSLHEHIHLENNILFPRALSS